MNTLKYSLVPFALYSCLAFAAAGSITISSPKDGAKLSGKAQVVYSVSPGPSSMADHLHLSVDSGKPAILPLQGSYTTKSLAPGNHDICLVVVDHGHTPIGLERCIKIKAE